MLEINEDKFKLKAFSEELEIRFPTGDQIDNANEKLQDSNHKGQELKVMRQLFLDLGLREDIVSRLQIDHYNKIFEALVQKKS